jgi:hypothetical protein
LQESVVQASLSSTLMGVCAGPVMGSQESVVQALPSSVLTGVWTAPDAGLQESVVQTLPSSVFRGVVPALHAPAAQVSPVVQALPSSHGLVLGVKTQPEPASQESSVQELLSLQVMSV